MLKGLMKFVGIQSVDAKNAREQEWDRRSADYMLMTNNHVSQNFTEIHLLKLINRLLIEKHISSSSLIYQGP